MRVSVRLWARWLGTRVHPLRLAIEALCASWAMWPLCILAYAFVARMFYPIDLEWCEGGAMYEAHRMLHGLPLYTRANPSWAPLPYPPAHTAVLALLGIVHLDFWVGRLISVAFFGWLCWAVFRELHQHLHRSSFGIAVGLLAVATIGCGYPVVGQWYDLVRVDTMMLALVIVGLSRISEREPSIRNIVVAAICFTAAVYTKQTAAFFVAWACLFAFVREPLIGFKLSALTFGLCLVTLGVLQWTSDGGFWFWTVTGLQNHKIEDARITEGLRTVWEFAPFCVLIPIAALVLAQRKLLSERGVLWTGALFVAVPASLLPYAKAGGYFNNLMPMVVLVGPVAAMLVAEVARRQGYLAGIARWTLLGGLALFVFNHPLKAADYLPTAKDRQAANELNSLVASLPGGVVAPYLEFLPARNGHGNPHWHSMAVWDSIWRGDPISQVRALQHSKARWALINHNDNGDLGQYIRSNFKLAKRIPESAQIRMITGSGILIDELWDRGW
jgi:hypothetical protein